MTLFQWSVIVLFCLVLPAVLAFLDRSTKGGDVCDKGLITDNSQFSVRTPLEKIKDTLVYTTRKNNSSYEDELAKERIVSKYSEASGWLFLHDRISKNYSRVQRRSSLDLFAAACLILSMYTVSYAFDRLVLILLIPAVSIAVYFVFQFLFAKFPPRCIQKYHSRDYSSEKLPLIDKDSSLEEIDSFFDALLYPHIDRVKVQCDFMERKTRTIKVATTWQEIIVILLLVAEVILYCRTH